MLTDLVFAALHTVNPGNIFPPALVAFTDPFTSGSSLSTYSESGSPGTPTVSGGTCSLAHVGSKNTILTETSSSFSMPELFVAIHVDSRSGSPTGYDNSGVGIVKDQNNFLFASLDVINSAARIQIKIGGSNTFLGSIGFTWTAPFRIGLGLVRNSATLWADTGSGWTQLVTVDVSSYYDFTTAGNLSGWMAGFTLVNGGGNDIWVFSGFSAGAFGTVSTRDMTLVTNKDGSPYMPSGSVAYLTATCSDTVGVSYCGVFQYDLVANTLAQVGVIMVSRGGHIYNDLSAHIVVDGSTYRLLLSTWGNGFGNAINILYLGTSTNLLSGANVVSGMTQLSLPGVTGLGYTNPGTYDQMLVWDTPNSRWLLAYVITKDTAFSGNPFFAAAAYSPDLATWTLIGADTTVMGWEGAKIIPYFGSYCIAVGGPAGFGNDSRVYDQNMTYLGDLRATFSGGADTQPHPMAFVYAGSEYLITFDNHRYGSTTFTWGNWIVQKAPLYSAGQPVVCTATF